MFKTVTVNNQLIKAKIADNVFTQSVGLMFKKALKKGEGMLFVFKSEIKYPILMGFWMLFTYIPLDIIWIDKDYKVVDIAKNTIPWGTKNWLKILTKVYFSKKPFKYVLEVRAGFVVENNIEICNILKI